MHEIKISVIVPVYNVQDFLSQCIDSLLDQAIDLEIILVDDGSTDNSGQIADVYAMKYNHIKVIHQPNLGLPAARNAGMEIAKGIFIAFVDSDDYIKKDSLCALYQSIHVQNADIAVGNAIFCRSDGSMFPPSNPIPVSIQQTHLSGKQCFTLLMKYGSYLPMVYCYLYRRDYLERMKFKFEDLLHEDELWTPIVLIQANRTVITGYEFYYYRLRNDSILHTTNLRRKLYSLFTIISRLIEFANRFLFSENDMELKGWLYVKIFNLYSIAFSVLPRIKDSTFVVPEFQMEDFWKNYHLLPDDVKKQCQQYYRYAEKMMDMYHYWRRSEWVAFDHLQNFEEKKIILIYNTTHNILPCISDNDIPQNYIITLDRKYLARADIVVFYIPELFMELEDDLRKPEGQLWIAWDLVSFENSSWKNKPDFTNLFDLWEDFTQDELQTQHPFVCLFHKLYRNSI